MIVGVLVGVIVSVAVDVLVGVEVTVGVNVNVGVRVMVTVGDGVTVHVALGVGPGKVGVSDGKVNNVGSAATLEGVPGRLANVAITPQATKPVRTNKTAVIRL